MVASYQDGSNLEEQRLLYSRMEVHTSVEMRSGQRRDLQTRALKMSDKPGVWEYYIDVRGELGSDDPRFLEQLNEISKFFS